MEPAAMPDPTATVVSTPIQAMVRYSIRSARRAPSGWVTARLVMGPLLWHRRGIEPGAGSSRKPCAFPHDVLGRLELEGRVIDIEVI